MPVDDSYDTLVGRVKLKVLPFLGASQGKPRCSSLMTRTTALGGEPYFALPMQ
jgi:hypothetical protein